MPKFNIRTKTHTMIHNLGFHVLWGLSIDNVFHTVQAFPEHFQNTTILCLIKIIKYLIKYLPTLKHCNIVHWLVVLKVVLMFMQVQPIASTRRILSSYRLLSACWQARTHQSNIQTVNGVHVGKICILFCLVLICRKKEKGISSQMGCAAYS